LVKKKVVYGRTKFEKIKILPNITYEKLTKFPKKYLNPKFAKENIP